eukprot:403337913
MEIHIENMDVQEMQQQFNELNIVTTEGNDNDLNYSFVSDVQPSFLKTKERMKTILDLLKLRGDKYEEFETQNSDPQRAQLVQQFEQVQKNINLIKIKEGMYAPYDDEDQIFELSEEIRKDEQEKISTYQFCGSLNCPQCVNKSRPYPMKNPSKERRGLICIVCNKKFLYRDAMHEFAVQLDMREGVNQNQQEELYKEEDVYNELMAILTELRQTKNNKVLDYKMMHDDTHEEENTIYQEIETLKNIKDQLVVKQQSLVQGLEDKKNKQEQFYDDIRKIEKQIIKLTEQLRCLVDEVDYCQKMHEENRFQARRPSTKSDRQEQQELQNQMGINNIHNNIQDSDSDNDETQQQLIQQEENSVSTPGATTPNKQSLISDNSDTQTQQQFHQQYIQSDYKIGVKDSEVRTATVRGSEIYDNKQSVYSKQKSQSNYSKASRSNNNGSSKNLPIQNHPVLDLIDKKNQASKSPLSGLKTGQDKNRGGSKASQSSFNNKNNAYYQQQQHDQYDGMQTEEGTMYQKRGGNNMTSQIKDDENFDRDHVIGGFSKKVALTQKKSQILIDDEIEKMTRLSQNLGEKQTREKKSIRKNQSNSLNEVSGQHKPSGNSTTDDPRQYGGVPGVKTSMSNGKMKGKKYQSATKEGACQSCEQTCYIF